MGSYLNPGNKGFQEILQSEYVDKTGLIALVNKTVGTMGKLTCISRPRRFGKSYAAKMLCAYYDCSCDSHALFDDKEIARTEGYLTLLIHLGYLTWHKEDETAHIPNEEVRIEFERILEGTGVSRKWIELISRSRKLLEDTITGNEDAVTKTIEEIRGTQYAPTFYNNEQALRYVIKFAYIAAVDQYLKVEELPSGKGIADVVYLPKRKSMLPALVIELKWNKSSEGAIRQIKERNYPAILKDYGGEVVLVGISYEEKKKAHSCVIERV